MRAGYLRKNGVPYSEDAVVTEAFHRHDEPNGDVWFTVTTIVEDPRYLTQPFITSTSFRTEADQSKWNPAPCQTAAPLEKPLPGRAAVAAARRAAPSSRPSSGEDASGDSYATSREVGIRACVL